MCEKQKQLQADVSNTKERKKNGISGKNRFTFFIEYLFNYSVKFKPCIPEQHHEFPYNE
jgi:hypothetical protein